jgi:uncharacterized protein involved in exopolysaccharide biosynthesis
MSPEMRDEWQDDEINLLDYWRVLWKRKWMIVGLVFVAVFGAGSYSYFVMPKLFESKVRSSVPGNPAGEAQGSQPRWRRRGLGSFSEA